MTKKGHFQIACSRYFDAVHNNDLGLGINHPNQFFEESQNIIKGDIKLEPKSEAKEKLAKKEFIQDLDGLEFEEPWK